MSGNLSIDHATIVGSFYFNTQIGPFTIVPYDSQGVAGSAVTVKGGSGGGRIYTLAVADTPIFSGTGSDSTTLTCTGIFSNAYVTYSGGPATPASGTLITGNDSITQVYSGMSADTTYTFNVYPVNGDGVNSNLYSTQLIKTLKITRFVATGGSAINSGLSSVEYSNDGYNWIQIPSIFNNYGTYINIINIKNYGYLVVTVVIQWDIRQMELFGLEWEIYLDAIKKSHIMKIYG
jgi:hypothetical protein